VGCGSGVQGLAAEKRQATAGHGIRPGEHRRPRGRGGTHPGRISQARNVETPSGSGRQAAPGKPTVRKAQLPSGNRMTREANAGGRKAAGNRDIKGWPSAGRSRITGRIPGWCPGPKGR
jgi:hypothetical protein